MREIKFRAWDQGKMLPVNTLSCHSTNYHLNGLSFCHDWDGEGAYNFTADAIFMQYTGLKDKNGVEIYEGDIIFGGVTYGRGSAIPPPHEVKWEIVTIVKPYCDGQVTRVGFFFDEYDYTLRGCEVLGNIYEHPHLLEESK